MYFVDLNTSHMHFSYRVDATTIMTTVSRDDWKRTPAVQEQIIFGTIQRSVKYYCSFPENDVAFCVGQLICIKLSEQSQSVKTCFFHID